MNMTEIWHTLNEAVRGKIPVYEIARRCVGLPKETILELADKMEADLHIKPNSYTIWIKQQKIKEVNKK